MSLSRRAAPIVAAATAPGRGAVGIVRLSGANLAAIAGALCGRCPAPRVATLTVLRDAAGEPIDEGLVLYFPAPHSYTGEDVLELHGHGGPVVLQLLLARCLEVGASAGLRLAEPGEFTERAFLNDKIDLAQAEAVADLIDAGTEAAARSASRSLAGALSERVDALHARIVRLRTLVEATLDFPEEEIDFLQQSGARAQLDAIDAAIDELLDVARQGALLREGIRVVLAGQPNVGKSSLLNALAGAELAIVTPIPGTTRDRVGQTIQIEGVPVHVVDTAGLREHTADEVERIGIGRSWEAIADADCVLFLHDPTRFGQPDYEADEAAIAARLPAGTKCLHVHTKRDLVAGAVPEGADSGAPRKAPPVAGDGARSPAWAAPALSVSARTGEGLPELRRALLEQVGWHASPQGLFSARTRHVHALRRTREHLSAARCHLDAGDAALELLAEELRLAHDALGEITGAFGVDDLLGEIFARFCIGK